jgi:hypothetical protein
MHPMMDPLRYIFICSDALAYIMDKFVERCRPNHHRHYNQDKNHEDQHNICLLHDVPLDLNGECPVDTSVYNY